jgi:hypothetical protein
MAKNFSGGLNSLLGENPTDNKKDTQAPSR